MIKHTILSLLCCVMLIVSLVPQMTATAAVPPQAGDLPYAVYLPTLHNSGTRQPFLAKNVIVMIGDGMGLEQIKAGGMYLNGKAGTLPFESFPYRALVMTYSANDSVTDSAAAATAMSTGQKVNNGVISVAIPGDGHDLYSILEYARDQGMSTGLVTTAPITHATPAGFGAHTSDRNHTAEIAGDYLHGSRPNVLFGGGGEGISPSSAQSAGYTVVTSRSAMQALNTEAQTRVSGQFGTGALPYEYDGLGSLPQLSQMAYTALRVLDNNSKGFFVMIEGGKIDYASHANDAPRMVAELAEFSRTVQTVLDWAKNHPDTLIIILADHETGGLTVTQNNGSGHVPGVTWGTTGHTGQDVGVWIYGPNPGSLPAAINNTSIPNLVTGGGFQPN